MSKPTRREALDALSKLGIKNNQDAKDLGFQNREHMLNDFGKGYDPEGKGKIVREVGKLSKLGEEKI